jgi:hypothetical protein
MYIAQAVLKSHTNILKIALRDCSIIHFGEHHDYVATIFAKRYPRKVLSCTDTPLGVPAGHSSGLDLCSQRS